MRILLAVSGGVDSMYLAWKAPELFPGASFTVAHCNFCLRGSESDGDQTFVQNWCSEQGLEFHCTRFDTLSYAKKYSMSTEMAARELRYKYFAELCSTNGYDAVAVAHNANDNAETLILNLLRGTGIKGICGMQYESRIYGAKVLRPLLEIPRKDIENWMRENAHEWRNDSTNDTDAYKRNVVRGKVFKVFEELNPSFLETLSDDMEHFRQAGEVIDEYCRQAFDRVRDESGNIVIDRLLQEKHREYLLYSLIAGKLNRTELESLNKWLSGPAEALSEYRQFGSVRAQKGVLWLGVGESSSKYITEIIDWQAGMQVKQPSGTLILDAEKFGGKFDFRHWQDGDWMIPLGMKGRKKLSDIFGDLGYTQAQKEAATVLEYPGTPGRIAAIAGVRIDDTLKVSDSTRKVLKITV